MDEKENQAILAEDGLIEAEIALLQKCRFESAMLIKNNMKCDAILDQILLLDYSIEKLRLMLDNRQLKRSGNL